MFSECKDDAVPIRRLTETGTLFTDVGKSNFYHQGQLNHRSNDTVQRKRSLTGSTVTQAGSSQFYSKPPVEEFACSPPHIVTKNSVKPIRKLAKTGTIKFPQLKEFAHFHYNKINIGSFRTYIEADRPSDKDGLYGVVVESGGSTWVVYRSPEHFKLLDRQVHYCVFDRRYSELAELDSALSGKPQEISSTIFKYLERFSTLPYRSINCGTVLNFFELNSNGGRLISPSTNSAINIPAVAAALVTKAYHACDIDELELKEGDLISVIDKPLASESSWWRGKKELEVGFFPSECVEVIGSRKSSVSNSEGREVEKLPVLRKRDKVIAFLRQFFLHRPARSQLKQSGIVKERVFGTDLGEYLSNAGLLLPRILTCCCDVIETHGLVDGIYRLSGRATQVQKLREQFDLDRHAGFTDEDLLDVHTVSTLLKTYFRELPTPLLTYQLYDPLVSCVQLRLKHKQPAAIKNHIATLPPTHYRTAKFLFAHLSRLAAYSKRTSMTSRNLAIVWAPNLIRYDESTGSTNALGLLQNVTLQAAVTEIMISNYQVIFCDPAKEQPSPLFDRKPHVKSLSKRLLSLSMARKRQCEVARTYRSVTDYPTIRTNNLSLDDRRTVSTAVEEPLSGAQSVSLDSVFTSSTSGTVHMLPDPAKNKETFGQHSPRNDIPSHSSAHSSAHSSTSTVTGSRTSRSSLDPQPKPVAKVAPTPKPRLHKVVHDYVNFQPAIANKAQGLVHIPTNRKPIPAVRTRSAQSVKQRRPVQLAADPAGGRPRSATTPELSPAPHASPISPITSGWTYYSPHNAAKERTHYAVSNVSMASNRLTTSSISHPTPVSPLCGTPVMSETGISKLSERHHPIVTGLTPKPSIGEDTVSASQPTRSSAGNRVEYPSNHHYEEEFDNNMEFRSLGDYRERYAKQPTRHHSIDGNTDYVNSEAIQSMISQREPSNPSVQRKPRLTESAETPRLTESAETSLPPGQQQQL